MRHKFAKGTKVWARPAGCPRRRGTVLGYDEERWALVGFSRSFDGHSGCNRLPVPDRYIGHCWFIEVDELTRVKVQA
jgi:hypothetical protein